jgi:uncharacterized protein YjbI with pentapeptide repeats
MGPMRRMLQHKAIILVILVLIGAGIWFWGELVEYIGPKDSTDRKDVVQVFALIVAGLVGFIGTIVGIANLSVSRRNLEQQIVLEERRRESTRELENQRTQEAALQAYFEQMGDLLTDHNLLGTAREDIRLLAQAQTLTVLAKLTGTQKGSLVRFLHGAMLIDKKVKGEAIVHLTLADLSGADLSGAYLKEADLSGAIGWTEEQLTAARCLEGATMPNGQKYEDWLKEKETHGKDEKN